MIKKCKWLCVLLAIMLLVSACASNEVILDSMDTSSDKTSVNSSSDSEESGTELSEAEKVTEQVVFEETALYSEMESTGKTSEEICADIEIELMQEELPTEDEYKERYPNYIGGKIEVERNTDFSINDSISLEGVNADILPPITNSDPIDGMCSEITDTWVPAMCSFLFPYVDHSWTGSPSISEILNREVELMSPGYKLPINFLRKIGDTDYFYSVDKVKDGGYLYSIFGPGIKLENGVAQELSKDITDMYYYGAVYSENSRTYSDFSDIKIGSSIYDVIQVDSSAKMTLLGYRYIRDSQGIKWHRYTSSVLLLEDGILEFIYTPRNIEYLENSDDGRGGKLISNATDDLVVSEINYYSYFKYIPSEMKNEMGVEIIVPIQILPQDYPPAS